MCSLGSAVQHEVRNGVIEIGFCLSRLYRSPAFALESTVVERDLLARAQGALSRVSIALEPCIEYAECTKEQRI